MMERGEGDTHPLAGTGYRYDREHADRILIYAAGKGDNSGCVGIRDVSDSMKTGGLMTWLSDVEVNGEVEE